MKMKIEVEDLKKFIMELNQETVNKLIKNSFSEEDRHFYNELYNFSLQMKQEKLIKEGKF